MIPVARLCRKVNRPGSTRYLNVHEYISMEIMKSHGIQTPECYVASTPDEAELVFENFQKAHPGHSRRGVVIKAQVLSGGRGPGRFRNGFQGGVRTVNTGQQAREVARSMIGQELVTEQAPGGILCSKVLLMEEINIRREMYLSILMDRSSQGPLIVAIPRGGTFIDEVALTNPEVIFTQPIDIMEGIQEDQCHRLASNLGTEESSRTHAKAVELLRNMYSMFVSCDCSQIEVNPLVETSTGNLVVCNAKVNFDDNAAYRQPRIFAQRDSTQQDEREAEANTYGLTYVGLEGTIGCMVNGAGLAMATMDMIQLKGGVPANFLDVGGGANEGQVQKAFEILNNDPRVKVILVNIFGGLMRCDVIATGIINAAKGVGINKPIVIRLQGTNVDEAEILIEAAGFRMILATDLDDAAEKAVKVAEVASTAEKLQNGMKFEGFLL